MISKKLKNVSAIILISLPLLFSCKKEAGEGGSSSVAGHVWAKDYNASFTLLNGEYDAMDEDVFIIYGDEKGYSDKTKTNYLGEYQFRYLRPGKYTVYMFSKDSTMLEPSGTKAIVKEIEITEEGQDVEVPEIVIFK